MQRPSSVEDEVGIGGKQAGRTHVTLPPQAARGEILLGQGNRALIRKRLTGDLTQDDVVTGERREDKSRTPFRGREV